MKHGHIKLSRKLFDGSDVLWEPERPRTRFEAWLDLIQMAAWKDGAAYTTPHHGVDVLARGELVASLRYLGQRWHWDKMKVSRFFDLLEKAGRVARQRAGQHGSVYLVVNYDAYQRTRDERGTASETASETVVRQERDKEEAVKQGKAPVNQQGASEREPAPVAPLTGWQARFPEPAHRIAVQRFLDAAPDDRRDGIEAVVLGWLDGMGLAGMRPATPAAVASALLEYGASGHRDYSARHLAAFVQRAVSAPQILVQHARTANAADTSGALTVADARAALRDLSADWQGVKPLGAPMSRRSWVRMPMVADEWDRQWLHLVHPHLAAVLGYTADSAPRARPSLTAA